jgi:hypothetical protein
MDRRCAHRTPGDDEHGLKSRWAWERVRVMPATFADTVSGFGSVASRSLPYTADVSAANSFEMYCAA